MTKYNYKRIIINSDFWDLFDGKKLTNDHHKFETVNARHAFAYVNTRTPWDLSLDYSKIIDKKAYDLLYAKYGSNYKIWNEADTDQINYSWQRRETEIAKAISIFNEYQSLLASGYKVTKQSDTIWYFELVYEEDSVLDIAELEFKLHQVELKLACTIEDKTNLNTEHQKLIRELGSANFKLNECQINLKDSQNYVQKLTETIKGLRSDIVSLNNGNVSLVNDLNIATSRAEHLEISLDEVTNDNHLLRAQVKSLEEKSKKKGWFK
jgi:hypothetical protein